MDNQAYSLLQQSALHVSTLPIQESITLLTNPISFLYKFVPVPFYHSSNAHLHEFHFSYRPENFDQRASEHIFILTSVTVGT